MIRRDALLCLALLISSAEAMSWSDPITCYVLDAVLLIYCIVFTVLYFRIKISNLKPEAAPKESVYEGLNTAQMEDAYQELEAGQSSGATRRNRAPQPESQYEALRSPGNEEYQEIKKKTKGRSKGRTKQALSESRSDAAAAIEMDRLPPLPSRT